MYRFLAAIFFLLSALTGTATPARAGAWLLPEGSGQMIAGVGYVEGARRFDKSGARVGTATYRKRQASGFFEYGLTRRISLILAPTLAHDNGAAAVNTVTGSTSSAFGARLLIWEAPWQVVSVQALIQPGLKTGSLETQIAEGGGRNFAGDLRLMYGLSFPVFGLPAFLDLQPGVRLRLEPFPSEGRVDVTAGVRPIPRLLALLQLFNVVSPSRGPLIDRTAYSKLQGSLVYDLTPIWSVQLGGFRTIAGRNAIQEVGPFGGIWYRF